MNKKRECIYCKRKIYPADSYEDVCNYCYNARNIMDKTLNHFLDKPELSEALAEAIIINLHANDFWVEEKGGG